ncbi:hypothetical protein ACHAPE_003683 [Trichoderma viride]
MSPHAVDSQTLGQNDHWNLSKFAVTKNAFLPEESQPDRLSDPYYESWELVAHNLAELIEAGRVHDAIRKLPVLSTDLLKSEAEWRRAYVILAFFTHAYVWGGEKAEQILPASVAVPFLRVSAHLELPPVLTYAACNLWNFSCSGDDFSKLEDLSTLATFTGTESEAWFMLVSVAIEATAAPIIHTMLRALDAVKTRDYEVIIKSLEELKVGIDNTSDLMERMYERCDPMEFYYKVRPFLAGSMNMEDAGLPNGVFYSEGDGKGEWRKIRGGSNAQSSLIQFYDAVLGIEHNGHSTSTKSFHDEIREYMPGPHGRFLVHVARSGSLRGLALETPVREEQHRLREAYTAAVDALTEFRGKHVKLVTRYIIIPSKKPWAGTTRRNLASSSSRKGGEGLMGTGGTELIPFLRQAKVETEVNKIERPEDSEKS